MNEKKNSEIEGKDVRLFISHPQLRIVFFLHEFFPNNK